VGAAVVALAFRSVCRGETVNLRTVHEDGAVRDWRVRVPVVVARTYAALDEPTAVHPLVSAAIRHLGAHLAPLRRFVQWSDDASHRATRLSDLTPAWMGQYLRHLAAEVQPATVETHRRALAEFLAWTQARAAEAEDEDQVWRDEP
jgi:hypothetical protein